MRDRLLEQYINEYADMAVMGGLARVGCWWKSGMGGGSVFCLRWRRGVGNVAGDVVCEVGVGAR